jgi:hypothetical protein
MALAVPPRSRWRGVCWRIGNRPGALSAVEGDAIPMLRVTALVLPLALVSCSGAAAKAPADAQSLAKTHPTTAPTTAAAEDPQVTGTVAETMDAGGYTYVRLKTANGEVWAAVNQTALKTGSEVTIGNAMWMDRFESKTLNRTFERILFGSLVAPAGATAPTPGRPATSEAAVAQSPHAAVGSGAADVGDVKVEKATGKDGRTVAEIYASKATLKGTGVSLRGRVVKWNPEIMGRNWIHLRDGSGSPQGRDNDITVTTADTVAKGDIVLVRGTVALDRDFGAGYTYPVMLENATIAR